jgi:hypothetical protein
MAVDPRLIAAIIQQESGGDPNAVSPAGAQGLMQVMPATARDPGFGINPLADPFDPEENKRFGTDYMGAMMDRYQGDIPRALAAYNWGPGNADRWSGEMADLPEETQTYIANITGNYEDPSWGVNERAEPTANRDTVAALRKPSIAGALTDPQFYKDVGKGALDVAGTLGSSIVLEPLAGLAGLAGLTESGEQGAENVEALRSMGYTPDQGSVGARALENIGTALAPLGEGIQAMGDYAYEKTGSPMAGALVQAGAEGALELLGGGAATQGAMGIVRKMPDYDPRKTGEEWEQAAAPAEASQNTQIAQVSKKEPGKATGTGRTYEKAQAELGTEGAGLDFGAGRGEGTQFLGGDVDTFEPFPREGFEPTYRERADILPEHYDRLLSSATFNVTPPRQTALQAADVARALRPGGQAIVSARTPSDVLGAKTAQEIEGLPGVRIGEQYQQGYTPDQLVELLQERGLMVEKQPGFSGATVRARAPEVDPEIQAIVEAQEPGRSMFEVGRKTDDGGVEVARDYSHTLPADALAKAWDEWEGAGNPRLGWDVAKLNPDGSVTLRKHQLGSDPTDWKLVSQDDPLFSDMVHRGRGGSPSPFAKGQAAVDAKAAELGLRTADVEGAGRYGRSGAPSLRETLEREVERVRGRRPIIAALEERGLSRADAEEIQASMGSGGDKSPVTTADIDAAVERRQQLLSETADRKPVQEMTPEELEAFGGEYGVDTRLTPMETVVDEGTGREWQLPGGLDRGKPLTVTDAAYIKSQAIDPNEMSPEFQARLQEKMLDATTPEPGAPFEMFNRMMLAQQSSNTPLLGNEFLAMRMRVRTPEDLDRLADQIDWEPGAKVPKSKRAEAEKRIAEAYGIGAGKTGGMGLRSSPDLSALAEMAKLYRKNPDWFEMKPNESWVHYAERMMATQQGLSMKTASFGTVWRDPGKAEISAMDRHMARKFMPEILDDPKLGPEFKRDAIKLWNEQNPDKKVRTFPQLQKKAGDKWVYDRVIEVVSSPTKTKYRDTKGNIRDVVPEHLRDLPIDPPGGQVTFMSPYYRKMLESNSKSAHELGLSVFGEQWRLWDRIRRGIEPHEAMHRDAQKLPPMTAPELMTALRTQKQAGFSTPEMDPTKPKRQKPYDYQKGIAWLTGGREVPQMGLARGSDLASRQAQGAVREETDENVGMYELLQSLRQ